MALHAHSKPTSVQLRWAILLTSVLTGLEVAGAWTSHSMALWGEAVHFLADLWAFGVARYALIPVASNSRWGYGRDPMIAFGGLINALMQIALAAWIGIEAVHRWLHPEPIEGGLMLAIAALGLAVNVGLMRLFGGRHVHQDDAVEGARIHFVADAGLCGATVLTALGVTLGAPVRLDAVLAFLAASLMVVLAARLMYRVSQTLLGRIPAQIVPSTLIRAIEALPGVVQAHHLHAWRVNEQTLASVHVLVHDTPTDLLDRIHRLLHDHQVDHVTVQMETHCPDLA